MAATVAAAVLPDGSDATDVSTVITDGRGDEYTFESLPNKIITVGVGVTATAIQLGQLDKIVVSDKSSKADPSSIFDGLRERIENGYAVADGSIYRTGCDALISNITASTDHGFDKATDVIFITGSDTYVDSIKNTLTDSKNNFKYVMVWNSINEYSQIADFVDTVSKVCTGHTSDKAEQMRYVSNFVKEKIAESGLEPANAFYITYSNSAYKVGNTGSLATSMIQAAGGNAFTIDETKSKPTYEENPTLLKDRAQVIFVDKSIWGDDGKASNLNAQTEGVTKVQLDPLWNNFSVESMDGVWVMASAMYPTLFEGDVPIMPSSDEDNMVLYIAGAAIALIAVGVVAFILMKR